METIKQEIRRLLKILRDKGADEDEIRKLFEIPKSLSRLLITEDCRIILVDYERVEVKFEPLHRAVYILFLKHEEGIRIKELPDYREELESIYMKMKKRTQAKRKVHQSIIDVTDPLKPSISEKLVRIRKALVDAIGDKSNAMDYYAITGKRGEARRIPLDRSLVIWELDSPQP